MVNDWVTWFYLAPAAIGMANLVFGLGKGWGVFSQRGPLSRIKLVLNSTGAILLSAGLLATRQLGAWLPELVTNALIVFGISLAVLSLLGVWAIPWVRTNFQRLPPQLRRLGEQESVTYDQELRELEARRQARAARRQA